MPRANTLIHFAAPRVRRPKTFNSNTSCCEALTGEFEQVESGLINCVRQNHPRKEEVLETLAQCYMRDFELLKGRGPRSSC